MNAKEVAAWGCSSCGNVWPTDRKKEAEACCTCPVCGVKTSDEGGCYYCEVCNAEAREKSCRDELASDLRRVESTRKNLAHLEAEAERFRRERERQKNRRKAAKR